MVDYRANCWIHGGKKLTYINDKGDNSETYANAFDCRANVQDDESNTLYYQWVAFMLAINALLFKIPHVIWKSFEGGIMKKLHGGKDARSALLEDEPMEKYLKFHETSFNKLSEGQKSIKYYTKFQFCQVLNLVILLFNWWITNQFLNRLFTSYGSDAVAYLNNPDKDKHNPMCNAFPTVVGCAMPTGETGGAVTLKHGICILSQNIVNEKIYLFLWFWFVFMFVAWAIQFIFEMAILAMKQFRSWLIEQQSGSFKDDGEMKKFVESCNLGDWFLLYQIGKNTNEEFFHKLIENLTAAAAPATAAAAAADVVEEDAPLINIESGNGMELRQRNQAD
jgi:hypothetical protein